MLQIISGIKFSNIQIILKYETVWGLKLSHILLAPESNRHKGSVHKENKYQNLTNDKVSIFVLFILCLLPYFDLDNLKSVSLGNVEFKVSFMRDNVKCYIINETLSL